MIGSGVLFDLDETLIDRTASISAYARRFYADFEPYIADRAEAFLETFLRLDGNGYVTREAFFQGLAGYIEKPEMNEETISAHFVEHAWTRPQTMRGAIEGLRRLRSAGLPVGVVTNGGSLNQRKKLTNTGLMQLVDDCVISEDVGTRKPDSAIFLTACGRLGIDPGHSWFVGDNPTVDIVGADQIGCRTIWLKRSIPWPEEHEPCYTFAVSSLENAFREILRDD